MLVVISLLCAVELVACNGRQSGLGLGLVQKSVVDYDEQLMTVL